MLIPIKDFYCKDLPDEAIEEAISIAKEDNCRVCVKYAAFHHLYEITITPEDTLESVKARLPRTYGL